MDNLPAGFHADIVALLPRLLRFCRALSRNAADADDLLQAAVERALVNAGKWRQGTRLDSWIYRIAQNIAIDWSRASAVRGVPAELDMVADVTGDDGIAVVEGRSDLGQVALAFAALPAEQRAVLTLVTLDGLSYREAAEILDVPAGTVMSRLSRARGALQKSIDVPDIGEGRHD